MTMEGTQAAGQIVIALRVRENLAPDEFAKIFGIEIRILTMIESGERMPSEALIDSIVEKLGRSEREKEALTEFLLVELSKKRVPARVVPLITRAAPLSFDELIALIR